MKPPFDIVGLDHIVLRVRDLAAALEFYRGTLGCTLERERTGMGLYQLRAGKQLIDLVPLGTPLGGEEPPDRARRNQDHFCLQISPFDAAALGDWLTSRGVVVGKVAERYGAGGEGPSVYIEDPDGNTIELKEAR